MSNEREDGFYWVRCGADWRIAMWDRLWGGEWFFVGDDDPCDERDIDEVDERRVVREE